jgi:hypothetical protein
MLNSRRQAELTNYLGQQLIRDSGLVSAICTYTESEHAHPRPQRPGKGHKPHCAKVRDAATIASHQTAALIRTTLALAMSPTKQSS